MKSVFRVPRPARSPRPRICGNGPAARRLAASLGLALLSACAVGPDYQRPSAPVSSRYKEAPVGGADWIAAAPADALDRGDWWRRFDDSELDRLARDVDAANQTVAGALASYRQAEALVREARAAYFPSLGLGIGASRSGGGRDVAAATSTGRSGSAGTAYSASLNGDWAPDFWGHVSRNVEGARAGVQASTADLAAARLSAQAAMAIDYFSLREADFEAELLQKSIDGYDRALTITQNRYNAGVVAKTDVLQAQTQLATTRSALSTVRANRARLEHAIALLTGKPAGDFAIAAGRWNAVVPAIPLGVPSALLQRRPDIASAERQVAAANAQIGVQRSAYFPSLTLNASLGNAGSRIGDLFKVSNALWSVGASVAQTLFDAGAIAARVSAAEAARDIAVARYRQTVLAAFQAVEDQLTNARADAEQAELQQQASDAADLTEQQILNRYRAGQLGYTDVVTAQASALSARRALVQVAVNRQIAAVSLIQALGGGWDSAAAVETNSSVRGDSAK
ncbi:MAG: efflux transporter outer membrane subunit [Pseudomonadota bacterium]|nr:efflux transporter outer membrane subunit [Pseudomonadota bacterium]